MATLTPATRMTNTEEDGQIHTPTENELHELMTESVNSASHGFDTKSALEIARIINHEDSKIAGCSEEGPARDCAGDRCRGARLARRWPVDLCRCRIERPHRRTGCLGVPARLLHVAAIGAVHRCWRPKAVASAVEVNEDSPELGQRDIARRRPTRKDVVIGLSASGRTPYVVGAVEYARSRGAHTAAITCNQNTALAAAAEIAIVAEVGPEVISGSTRMKAATAQKMITNMITTGAMTRLGYVYENMMVNVHMHNAKLVERGIGVLMRACNIDRETAVQTIKSAGKSVPIALVMLKAGVDKPEAVRRLAKADGNVRLAIEDTVLEL